MKLSVVSTLYNCRSVVEEFLTRVITQCETRFGEDFTIILVDDGSTDDTVRLVAEAIARDPRILLFVFSRNFGHHAAIRFGLSQAQGDLVFLIDSDLEESPEWLVLFHQEMMASAADAVIGIQTTRKGRGLERRGGGIFWKLLNLLSEVPIVPDQTTARLMTRRFVDALLSFREYNYFFAGVVAQVGFEQRTVLVEKLATSTTSYTLPKRIQLAVNAIVSNSGKPLVAISMVGIFIFGITVIASAGQLLGFVLYGSPVEGWTSLILAVFSMGGFVVLSLGVIGLYIHQILLEVKSRPRFVLQDSIVNPPTIE